MKEQIAHRKKVLLVDDEKNLTQMLSMLLETRGYDVTVANSGKEAFERIDSFFDLIILDIVLPDINGFQICESFKNDQTTHHIPIIMISAQSQFEDRVEGLYLGADDFLTKPCVHEELFARMEVAMRRSLMKETNNIIHDTTIISELRRILDGALIIPYFQPVYQFEPFCLYGVELLTRPTSNTILSNPEAFFRAALEYGLYTEIEMLSWTLAMNYLGQKLDNEKIFLNCNPYFIETIDFDQIKTIFKKNNINPNKVILEITERSAITNYKLFYKRLKSYRDYGFRFAVDDVGGGYASLESIVQTKPEVVKIDSHIISQVSHDPYKQSIVKFIVSFCRENNIISIAEGIENEEDLQIVKKLGVTSGQGYFLYRPTATINLNAFSKGINKPSV